MTMRLVDICKKFILLKTDDLIKFYLLVYNLNSLLMLLAMLQTVK